MIISTFILLIYDLEINAKNIQLDLSIMKSRTPSPSPTGALIILNTITATTSDVLELPSSPSIVSLLCPELSTQLAVLFSLVCAIGAKTMCTLGV
jgi:hypothetical protein